MLSPLSKGRGSWEGGLLLPGHLETSKSLPNLDSDEQQQHRHGVTVTPRTQTARPTLADYERPSGELVLPKTFTTRNGALLLFTHASQEFGLSDAQKRTLQRDLLKVRQTELSAKFGTLTRFAQSVLSFGDDDYPHDTASISDPRSRVFLKFLRGGSTDLESSELSSLPSEPLRPGDDISSYLRHLRAASAKLSSARSRSCQSSTGEGMRAYPDLNRWLDPQRITADTDHLIEQLSRPTSSAVRFTEDRSGSAAGNPSRSYPVLSSDKLTASIKSAHSYLGRSTELLQDNLIDNIEDPTFYGTQTPTHLQTSLRPPSSRASLSRTRPYSSRSRASARSTRPLGSVSTGIDSGIATLVEPTSSRIPCPHDDTQTDVACTLPLKNWSWSSMVSACEGAESAGEGEGLMNEEVWSQYSHQYHADEGVGFGDSREVLGHGSDLHDYTAWAVDRSSLPDANDEQQSDSDCIDPAVLEEEMRLLSDVFGGWNNGRDAETSTYSIDIHRSESQLSGDEVRSTSTGPLMPSYYGSLGAEVKRPVSVCSSQSEANDLEALSEEVKPDSQPEPVDPLPVPKEAVSSIITVEIQGGNQRSTSETTPASPGVEACMLGSCPSDVTSPIEEPLRQSAGLGQGHTSSPSPQLEPVGYPSPSSPTPITSPPALHPPPSEPQPPEPTLKFVKSHPQARKRSGPTKKPSPAQRATKLCSGTKPTQSARSRSSNSSTANRISSSTSLRPVTGSSKTTMAPQVSKPGTGSTPEPKSLAQANTADLMASLLQQGASQKAKPVKSRKSAKTKRAAKKGDAKLEFTTALDVTSTQPTGDGTKEHTPEQTKEVKETNDDAVSVSKVETENLLGTPLTKEKLDRKEKVETEPAAVKERVSDGGCESGLRDTAEKGKDYTDHSQPVAQEAKPQSITSQQLISEQLNLKPDTKEIPDDPPPNARKGRKSKKDRKKKAEEEEAAAKQKELLQDEQRQDKQRRLAEAAKLQELIKQKDAERQTELQQAQERRQALEEELALVAQEAEQARLAEQDATAALSKQRKAAREEREARRKADLERRKSEAHKRREGEKRAVEEARKKEKEMLERMASMEQKRQMAEQERLQRQEEEEGLEMESLQVKPNHSDSLKVEDLELEEQMTQMALVEEERITDLENQAEEEAMTRLVKERKEAERRQRQMEEETQKVRRQEEEKWKVLLDEKEKLQQEASLQEQKAAAVEVAEQQRLQKIAEQEENLKERQKQEAESRRGNALRRRELNLERRSHLHGMRQNQNVNQAWTWSYYIRWPRETYVRMVHEDPRLKKPTLKTFKKAKT